jgi:hypothetical protein
MSRAGRTRKEAYEERLQTKFDFFPSSKGWLGSFATFGYFFVHSRSRQARCSDYPG